MNVYVWKDRHGDYLFNASEPKKLDTDDVLRGLRAGDIVGDFTTYVIPAANLDGIKAHLPEANEVKNIGLHELWGLAKDAPGYDKKLWTNLQRALGD